MPREHRLFGDVTDPSVRLGNRRWYTVPLSILVHALAIAVLVIVPLLAVDALPSPRAMQTFLVSAAPPPPPPAPPPPPRGPSTPAAEIVSPDVAPREAPEDIVDEPPFDTTFDSPNVDGARDGRSGGIPDGIPHGDLDALIAPPPPPAPAPPPEEPVRVGGEVVPPVKTRDAAPLYPPIARAAGISGAVIIEATIGPDGRVQNARVLRSVPLLDEAALEAVRQWEFTPTLLNGAPVAVLMTVTVVFSLTR
jgi:periplasmic protein TonB